MRLSFCSLAGLAVVVSAQSVTDLPACAQECVTKFTSGGNIGNCNAIQAACICSSPTFLNDIACCLASACDVADQEKATQFAQTFCKISGVTDLPTAVSCSSTAAAGSTSGASSTSASSGSAMTTPASGSSSESTAGAQSGTSSGASSSPSAEATGNTGAQQVVGYGAGLFGGLAAFAALV